MEKITFRAVVEILGKPKEHIEKTLHGYLEKINNDEKFNLISKEVMEAKEQEKTDLWVTFAEVEVECKKVEDITAFCFDYMPSIIEILEPADLKFKNEEVSRYLNDLQAKLHQIDMIAKQLKMENDHLKHNTAVLLRNYLMVLLGKSKLSLDQMSKLTGVDNDKLGDYLDRLIDDGKVDLDGDLYFLKKESEE
jgi:hypothetical protein